MKSCSVVIFVVLITTPACRNGYGSVGWSLFWGSLMCPCHLFQDRTSNVNSNIDAANPVGVRISKISTVIHVLFFFGCFGHLKNPDFQHLQLQFWI